jgi:hypothetical protein
MLIYSISSSTVGALCVTDRGDGSVFAVPEQVIETIGVLGTICDPKYRWSEYLILRQRSAAMQVVTTAEVAIAKFIAHEIDTICALPRNRGCAVVEQQAGKVG